MPPHRNFYFSGNIVTFSVINGRMSAILMARFGKIYCKNRGIVFSTDSSRFRHSKPRPLNFYSTILDIFEWWFKVILKFLPGMKSGVRELARGSPSNLLFLKVLNPARKGTCGLDDKGKPASPMRDIFTSPWPTLDFRVKRTWILQYGRMNRPQRQ